MTSQWDIQCISEIKTEILTESLRKGIKKLVGKSSNELVTCVHTGGTLQTEQSAHSKSTSVSQSQTLQYCIKMC